MITESKQDDEIHHSVGKVNFEPCPEICHTQFTRILLHFPLSPPPRQPAQAQDNEGHGNHCCMKWLFKKFFKHKNNPTYIVNIVTFVNYEVKELTLIDNCTIIESTQSNKNEES